MDGNYWVYVLLSEKDKKFYVGMTADLVKRLKEHVAGNVESTKNRRPLKVIHYEYFICREDARAREVFFKSGYGRDQMKKSLKKTLEKYKMEE